MIKNIIIGVLLLGSGFNGYQWSQASNDAYNTQEAFDAYKAHYRSTQCLTVGGAEDGFQMCGANCKDAEAGLRANGWPVTVGCTATKIAP